MAGNKGHQFFGNQYKTVDYFGGYHYDWTPNSDVTKTTKIGSQNSIGISSSNTLYENAQVILPISSKNVKSGSEILLTIGVVSIITMIGTFIYFHHKHIIKKNKLKDKVKQKLDIEKVGICKYCDNPLSESIVFDENTKESDLTYIICIKCGEKNYSWYPEYENNNENS